MPKHLLLLLFVLCCFSANAQSRRYLTADGSITADIKKADSYITTEKLSDTAYRMKQYDMTDSIMTILTFKDEACTILNGPCTYYVFIPALTQAELKKIKNPDSFSLINLHFIDEKGQFKNGKKWGDWTKYLKTGIITKIVHYENDEMNGPEKVYNLSNGKLLAEGNLKNGQKDGEWHRFDAHGEISSKEGDRQGRLLSSQTVAIAFVGAKPTKDFNSYLEKELSGLHENGTLDNMELFVGGNIDKQGKFKDKTIKRLGGTKPISDKTKAAIIGVIENAPLWRPATSNKNAVEDIEFLKIYINNDDVTIVLIDQGASEYYYRLTH